MEDCKAKAAGKRPALKNAYRNDRAAVRHWLAGNGQALLPMLELLDSGKRSGKSSSKPIAELTTLHP
jgi:hypothetical protein